MENTVITIKIGDGTLNVIKLDNVCYWSIGEVGECIWKTITEDTYDAIVKQANTSDTIDNVITKDIEEYTSREDDVNNVTVDMPIADSAAYDVITTQSE